MRSKKPILLVDDDRVDVMTVKRAFKENNIPNSLDVVENGEQALEHLRNSGDREPCLILLDLNMPKMGGIEFLRIAKADQAIRKIPVVVLTTSTEEQDKVESFALGIAGYMLKPINFQEFIAIIKTIDQYWTVSELPGEA